MRPRGTIGAAATQCPRATPTPTPSRLMAAGLRGGRDGCSQPSRSEWTTRKVRQGKSCIRACSVRPKMRARPVRPSLTHPSRHSHRARSPQRKRRKLGRRSTSAQGSRAEPCGGCGTALDALAHDAVRTRWADHAGVPKCNEARRLDAGDASV